MKRFSTVSDTQRVSQSYMKKRRGRGDIEMSRRRKRGTQEERDRIYAVVCSQSVLRSPEHPQRFTELDWEEKGEGGNRGDLGRKRQVKRGKE